MDKRKTEKLGELLQEICDNIAYRDLFADSKPTESEQELEKMCREAVKLVTPRRMGDIQKHINHSVAIQGITDWYNHGYNHATNSYIIATGGGGGGAGITSGIAHMINRAETENAEE